MANSFRPMLACRELPADVHYPVLASVKLDGIRAIIKDGVVLSRKLKPIPSELIQKKFGKKEFEGFDGELICGDPGATDCYRRTSSAVMGFASPDAANVQFYVFDSVTNPHWPFIDRLAYALSQLQKIKIERSSIFYMVEQHECMNEEELLAFEAKCLEHGAEGVIVRVPYGAYKYGRSTAREQGMMKVKRFVDSEAEVLEVIELQHNDNEQTKSELGLSKRSKHKANMRAGGTMGTLRVRDRKTGVEFFVGSGFTEEDRAHWWAIRKKAKGTIIKYKSFPIGVKDAPRHPVYLGIRDRIDL